MTDLTETIIINPFFIICMICGLIFTLGGWIFLKYPPKKINNWYGYRTSSSQKSQERWDFAQEYSSKQMIRMGILFMIISWLGFFLPGSLMEAIAAVFVLLIFTITFLYQVESEIKKKFNN
ncbi:SdpI family protein [Arenibacter sp. 6A1]|uniref:SdpI family protein n=1 Tax=Arenibacter sp. 6A1 TaxID=2720391 RepID=UPI001447694E|nr:SdpI family protein [Arenibacter sp. 6A1]NKI27893.1 SdpI family protein [Arenibacter sp. 6A1]